MMDDEELHIVSEDVIGHSRDDEWMVTIRTDSQGGREVWLWSIDNDVRTLQAVNGEDAPSDAPQDIVIVYEDAVRKNG